jgi:hypothetical protein
MSSTPPDPTAGHVNTVGVSGIATPTVGPSNPGEMHNASFGITSISYELKSMITYFGMCLPAPPPLAM